MTRAAIILCLLLAGCAAPPSAETAAASARPERTARPTPAVSVEATEAASPSPSTTEAAEPLAWSRLDAPGPAAREDHTWTVVGDGRTALLFGGRDGATIHGDLWSYDLVTDAWTELSVDGGPAARFGHEAAWVEGIGLVVFAGQAGTTFFDDLWAFDPSAGAWRQLPSRGDVPVARYGSCAAMAPDGRLWISHGFTSDGTRFSDTRAYDFDEGRWLDETPGTERPVERCLHGCWWTDRGELVLYAGQTTGITALSDRWRLADGAWTQIDAISPPERNLYARTRIDGATVVFGGQALDASFRDDLWLLPDASLDAIELPVAGGRREGRAGAELVRDVVGGRLLLFGGRGANGALADVWSLSGSIPAP